MQNASNYVAAKMPNADCQNPIETLDADQISYLQAYLEQKKIEKINLRARPNNLKYCTSIGDMVPKSGMAREMLARNPINMWNNQVNYPNCPMPRDVQP